MNNYVRVRLVDMPTTVPGFSIQTPDGWTTIILNSRCSHSKNLESYRHEMEHIENDDFSSELSVDEIEAVAHRKG